MSWLSLPIIPEVTTGNKVQYDRNKTRRNKFIPIAGYRLPVKSGQMGATDGRPGPGRVNSFPGCLTERSACNFHHQVDKRAAGELKHHYF